MPVAHAKNIRVIRLSSWNICLPQKKCKREVGRVEATPTPQLGGWNALADARM